MERREVGLSLREYQKVADSGIDEIFRRKEHSRFAGVVLPTGGGKSFVAISQMIKFGKPADQKIEIDESGLINNAKILYVAPSHEILNQVKLHFVKNILLSIDKIEDMSIAEIDDFLKRNLEGVDFPGINSGLKKGEKPIADSADKREKINAILRKLTVKDIDKLVSNAFPNLKLICYAGVKFGETISNQDIQQADLIITDEAHRLGATTWGKMFFENLKKNANGKILAITATPDRTDSAAKNMFAEIAREVYPEETITPETYMAQEIYVMDAMRDGIVLAPKVHQTNATLAISEQYTQILDIYRELEDDDPKKAIFGEALDEMEEIIGFSPRKMTAKELEEKVKEEQRKLIGKSIANPNGKYIAFIPANMQKDQERPDSAKYLADWKKRIIESFKDVRDEKGKPVKVTVTFLTSNSSIKLDSKGNPVIPKEGDTGTYTSIDNSQVIKDFEDASNETGGIKIIITNDILNEGVHVDGIDGSIMFRPAGSSTIYLQQSGRCISSLDPKKPLSMQPSTQIIDACGNSFAQVSKGTGRKSSVDYDLRRVKEIVEWIQENQDIPNINSVGKDGDPKDQARAEAVARLAISIKRIQKKYGTYYENDILPIEDSEKVASLLELAKTVDLFNLPIPERTVEPTEAELSGEGFLQYTDDQKRFMSIYDRVRSSSIRMTSAERINKLMNIVRVLKMYKKDIKFPQGIYIKGLSGGKENDSKEVMSEDAKKSVMLKDLLRENFDEATIQKILVDLKNYDLMQTDRYSEVYHDGEDYDIAKEMAFVRGKIYTSKRDSMKEKNYVIFDRYKLKDFVLYGVIQSGIDDVQKLLDMDTEYEFAITSARAKRNGGMRTTRNAKRFIDADGRIKPGFQTKYIPFGLIDRFDECSLDTGEKYVRGFDREGFDEAGYDIEGYNRFGFNRDGIHRITQSKYDERGFYFNDQKQAWVNRYTEDEYDLLGYNIYGFNKEGFERPIGPCPVKPGSKSWSYQKPLWHMRYESGEYGYHGYVYIQDLPKGQQTHDANGFETQTRHSDPNNPLFDKKAGTGWYFHSNGALKGSSSSGYTEYDFYLSGLDIDGYTKEGFKEVVYNGRKVFIHRDTSAIHDRKGMMIDPNQEKARGRLQLKPVIDPVIKEAKRYIVEVLGGNVSQEVFFSKMAKVLGKPINKVRELYKNALKQAFELYRYECPEAFDESGAFKGLDYYLLSNISNRDKRDRIDDFFKFCPEAKQLLVLQAKSNDKALRRLQKVKNKRAINKETLTKEEQEKLEAREKKQELYDQLEIDDRG